MLFLGGMWKQDRILLCLLCDKYIRLREKYNHESRCTCMSILDSSIGFSRSMREAERPQGANGMQPREFSESRLQFTVAIIGLAVLLGSFFLQRKAGTNQLH